jgi:hypothetical protein
MPDYHVAIAKGVSAAVTVGILQLLALGFANPCPFLRKNFIEAGAKFILNQIGNNPFA